MDLGEKWKLAFETGLRLRWKRAAINSADMSGNKRLVNALQAEHQKIVDAMWKEISK